MNTAPEEDDRLFRSESIIVPVTIIWASDEDDHDDEDKDYVFQGAIKEEGHSRTLSQDADASPRPADEDPPCPGEGGVEPSPPRPARNPPLRSSPRVAQRQRPSDQSPHAGKISSSSSLPTLRCPPVVKTENCAVKSEFGETPPGGGRGQLLTCAECPYATLSMYNMTCHARIHTGEKPYTCPWCAWRCRTRSCLNRHMRSESCLRVPSTRRRPAAWPPATPAAMPGPQVLRCADCDYRTANGYNMKVHLRVHTDERPYKCGRCDYHFRTQSHLYRHERLRCRRGEGPAQREKT